MDSGGQSAMVQKLIFFLFFFTKVYASEYTDPIQINWTGPKDVNCQKIVEIFLKELKSTTNNQIIEFNIDKKSSGNTNQYQTYCSSSSKNVLNIKNKDHVFELHYLGLDAGFDALDWLEFQKFALRQSQSITINTEKQVIDNTFNKIESKLESSTSKKSFWTPILIGTALGAAGGAIFSPDSNNRPLNILVFGLAGTAIGGIYAHWSF